MCLREYLVTLAGLRRWRRYFRIISTSFTSHALKARQKTHPISHCAEISILSLDHVRVERYDEREERTEHIHEADVFYRSDFDVMKSKVQVSD